MSLRQGKLCYVSNIRLPTEKAHGLQIMKMCEAFTHQGIETELVVSRRKNHLTDDPFHFYTIATRFQIARIGSIDLLWLPFFKKCWFLVQNITFYFSVKKYFSRKNSQIYYTRDVLIAAWASRRIPNMFYEIHSLPKKVRRIHRKAWTGARGIIAISQGIKDALISYGIPESKILVAHDAVDIQQFQILESKQECRAKLQLPQAQKIVLYTGHLYEWKGANLLAEAAEKLPETIHLYFVGGTNEDIELFKRKYPYQNIHIVGWQSHDVIPYWLRAADFVVLPTSAKEKIGDVYTSPLKLFEYIASGTPIIASQTQSIQEILKPGDATFFQPDDVSDLVEKIRSSIENNNGAQEDAAKKLAKNFDLSWDSRAEKILEFISKV